MLGQLLPEQANAPDSATTYGFAGPVTGTLPPLPSHQLLLTLGHAIKGLKDAAPCGGLDCASNATTGIHIPSAALYAATGATLNATSFVADTLTIGGDPIVFDDSTPPVSMPEPNTLVLA